MGIQGAFSFARYREALRFLLSGGVAAIANISTLYFLTDRLGFWYLSSSVLSFLFAFLVSFALQKFWTFERREREGTSLQLLSSLAVAGGNLGVNTLLMYALVEYATLHYVVAQIVTAGLIAVETYILYKYVVFARPYPVIAS